MFFSPATPSSSSWGTLKVLQSRWDSLSLPSGLSCPGVSFQVDVLRIHPKVEVQGDIDRHEEAVVLPWALHHARHPTKETHLGLFRPLPKAHCHSWGLEFRLTVELIVIFFSQPSSWLGRNRAWLSPVIGRQRLQPRRSFVRTKVITGLSTPCRGIPSSPKTSSQWGIGQPESGLRT